jgi:hypothetical protein
MGWPLTDGTHSQRGLIAKGSDNSFGSLDRKPLLIMRGVILG